MRAFSTSSALELHQQWILLRLLRALFDDTNRFGFTGRGRSALNQPGLALRAELSRRIPGPRAQADRSLFFCASNFASATTFNCCRNEGP